MSKWQAVQESFERAHDDLFSLSVYSAEFFNHSQGTRDNLNDEFTGETRTSLGSIQVEVVPPGMDTTVRSEGTSFSWDTTIRFPIDDKPGEMVPLGDDNRKPTEIEITNPEENDTDIYELHGYSYEDGSDMLRCRLVEQ